MVLVKSKKKIYRRKVTFELTHDYTAVILFISSLEVRTKIRTIRYYGMFDPVHFPLLIENPTTMTIASASAAAVAAEEEETGERKTPRRPLDDGGNR